MKALLFGGIGTLAETSELQRSAFNQAFSDLGLYWRWDRGTYRELLSVTGGAARIRHFADANGIDLDDETVHALHDAKTRCYQNTLAQRGVPARPGVMRLIAEAKASGVSVAIASTTAENNIAELAQASALGIDVFDSIWHAERVSANKPDPEVYRSCLAELGVDAGDAIAIEDSNSGVRAAVAAGIPCLATPGRYTSNQDFSAAVSVVTDLGDDSVQGKLVRGPIDLPQPGVTIGWLAQLAAASESRLREAV